jgi:hypothetical protein
VILFFLLVIAAVGQLIRAVSARHRLTLWMSAIGLLGVLGAGFAGIGFTGNGAAGASLGMSLAFAVSLAAYVVLIFALIAAPAAAWWSRARKARSTASRIWRAAPASMRVRCSYCRKAMRCGRSSATATRPHGALPASTPAPP